PNVARGRPHLYGIAKFATADVFNFTVLTPDPKPCGIEEADFINHAVADNREFAGVVMQVTMVRATYPMILPPTTEISLAEISNCTASSVLSGEPGRVNPVRIILHGLFSPALTTPAILRHSYSSASPSSPPPQPSRSTSSNDFSPPSISTLTTPSARPIPAAEPSQLSHLHDNHDQLLPYKRTKSTPSHASNFQRTLRTAHITSHRTPSVNAIAAPPRGEETPSGGFSICARSLGGTTGRCHDELRCCVEGLPEIWCAALGGNGAGARCRNPRRVMEMEMAASRVLGDAMAGDVKAR
ncbi:hypothetical protein Q9L58_010304, partial [Maublancomyces gigas]